MEKENLPSGLQLTPLDEEFRSNPYRMLETLRTHAPVFHDKTLNRFIFTRHDDVKSILRDKKLLRNPRWASEDSFLAKAAALPADKKPNMLFQDDPEHKRLRSLVVKPFTAAAVEIWRERTRGVVQRTLSQIAGDEFDLMEVFCNPVPTIVIAEMLGVDPEIHDDFKRWSDTVVEGVINPLATPEQKAAAQYAADQLSRHFAEAIRQRRHQPGDDLISDMVTAEENGQKLSEEEVVLQCNLLLIAGNVTTTDLIGNGIKALLDHPMQLKKLKEDPSLIKNTVEEVLRYDSPVQFTARIANDALSMRGCPIGKGDSMSASLGAANRDPRVYPNPDVFDIERQDTHHQSFGGGVHLCLGAHLARLEAQEAILGLLNRYTHLRHSDKGFTYAGNFGFRGLKTFWVKVGK